MVTLKSKGPRVTLSIPKHSLHVLSNYDRDLVMLAISSYSHVNNIHGAQWVVSIQQWIRNIHAVYGRTFLSPQAQKIIEALNKVDELCR